MTWFFDKSLVTGAIGMRHFISMSGVVRARLYRGVSRSMVCTLALERVVLDNRASIGPIFLG